MATGTGKTFTTISLAYRLIRSGVGKRILFLVDRRALAAQAASAFHAFNAEPSQKFDNIYEVYSQPLQQEDLDDEDGSFDPKVLPRNYLTSPQTKDAFVYICTIQRMAINLFGAQSGFELEADEDENLADVEKLDIPIHAFDVIIADECHRGYTASEEAKWRKVLDYFDAVKVVLTATPAAHTVGYFGRPVFTYSYDDAIREGRLVDYQEIHIQSDARINGVFLNEDERVSLVDPENGQQTLDVLEAEREYDATEIERKITSPDSNRKIIEEFKKYTDAHEAEYGRFPKILIFAANDKDHVSHADQVVCLCREVFGRGEGFVQKITGNPNVYKPLRRIKEFRNLPEPGIVVTVDMLSTGVDVKPIECIVFLRPVKSRILWEQMLGRGTRLCKDLIPPKDHFKVFDCFGGTLFEYFRNASGMTAEAPQKSSRTLAQVIEDIYQNRDRDYNIKCLTRRLQRTAKGLSGEGIEAFSQYIPDGDLAAFAQGLRQTITEDFMGTMQLLRNPDFQALLLNPPRAKQTFLVALDHEDTVTSQALIGKLKPEDYLQAFAQFIDENQAQIEAIGILLNKPEHWNPQQLTALRKALKEAPEHFTEQNLRRAYHEDLADIISMVKVAAKKEDQLRTGPERVALAITRIKADTTFTDEQLQWLHLIQMHLETNLSIDEQDFEALPVFLNKGGLGRARKIFGSLFQDLIKRINKEVAA